jgi:hypothetical protein
LKNKLHEVLGELWVDYYQWGVKGLIYSCGYVFLSKTILMQMPQSLRKFSLSSHITVSVGWLGAVAVFLVLAITGLTTKDTMLARSMYMALEICTAYVIVPFCLASLVTGLIQAMGTKWGLFKHYWIIVKLFLTCFMTLLLFLHLKPINQLSLSAAGTDFSNTGEAATVIELIKKAAFAVFGLIAVTAISVYKPWGKTKLGLKDQGASETRTPFAWRKLFLWIAIALVVFIILKHLVGGGMHHH